MELQKWWALDLWARGLNLQEKMVQKPAYGFILSPHGPRRTLVAGFVREVKESGQGSRVSRPCMTNMG